MNNIIPIRPNIQINKKTFEEEIIRRVNATKEVAKEAYPIIVFPFGFLGLIVGIKGFILGCSIGFFFYIIILHEMRYGKEI